MNDRGNCLKYVRRLIISYLITFAIYNIGGFESTDILLGVAFVAIYMLLGRVSFGGKEATTDNSDTSDGMADPADSSHKYTPAAGIVAFIWTILYVIYMGERIFSGLTNPVFAGIYVILTVAGLFVALYMVIRRVISILVRRSFSSIYNNDSDTAASSYNNDSDTAASSGIMSTTSVWRIWIIYTAIIFLCMLPLFLLNFPGTLTVDSFDQLSQARGLAPYSDHHPWVHTLVIKAFYSIGYGISHNVYGGIAAYTLIQMIIVAMSVSYAITVLGFGRKSRVLMLLGFVLYPYNLAYSITMWKDVLFAASVLVLTVTIFRMFVLRSGSRLMDVILFFISSLLMCMLRHNGLYAYILTMIVIFIYEITSYIKCQKKHTIIDKDSEGRRRLIVTIVSVAVVFLVTAIVKGPVKRTCNVEKDSIAYNYAIPLQQIARVVHDGYELTSEEAEALNKINDIDYLKDNYSPGGADLSVLWLIFGDSEYFESHLGEYAVLWMKLGLRYPDEYVKAYLDQTKGYYVPMAPEQTEYYGIMPNEDGFEPQPLLGAGVRIKINEICTKLHTMLPVYGILYSMGACFMLLILGAAIIILTDKCRLLTYLPAVTLTLTLIAATPLVADLRYAYPLMLCMPSLICITVKPITK